MLFYNENEKSRLKMHLVSIQFRGKNYPMIVFRNREEKKITVSLNEFRLAYFDLDIRDGETFSIG